MATTKGKTKSTAARTAGKRSTSAKAKKPSARRKYSPVASEYVEEEMKEMKQGKLKSGRSGKTVHNPKQAIAIGLSEARKAGAKVPKKPRTRPPESSSQTQEAACVAQARIVNRGALLYSSTCWASADGGGAGALLAAAGSCRRCRLRSRRWCRRKSFQSCWKRTMRWKLPFPLPWSLLAGAAF